MKTCYYCGMPVDQAEWEQVKDVTEFWMNLAGLSGMEDLADLFVHMTGAQPSNLDGDGNVVVCSRDALREMAESLANVE